MNQQTTIGIQPPKVKEPISETVKKVGYLLAGVLIGFIGQKAVSKK